MTTATAPIEQTLEQIRMRFAIAVVKHTMQSLEDKERKEYVARCKNLPAQVLQNGLNQALAFCASKEKEKSYAAILRQLDDWLTGRGAHYAALGLPQALAVFADALDAEKVLDVMQRHSMDDYILATTEALHLLHHIERFATAFAVE